MQNSTVEFVNSNGPPLENAMFAADWAVINVWTTVNFAIAHFVLSIATLACLVQNPIAKIVLAMTWIFAQDVYVM